MTTKVLADQFGATEGASLWLRRLFMIVFGVALLWISAKVKIAIEPVPVTLQVLAIMALSMAYGARMAAAMAENLPFIGTVQAPNIIYHRNSLVNVAEFKTQSYEYYRTYPYLAPQWFLADAK